ncbi:MAG: DnaJ domain-containing protein [Candidatus Riflebacteria bacterium]|nr:DnaJ domain-containing protein [Candidatus Riflebacteria bacterium]
MAPEPTTPPAGDDPWETLGVARESSPEEVRQAYLARVKESPPDRDPERFERVRDAYDVLRDPRRRIRALLESIDLQKPLTELLGADPPRRRFVSARYWREALEKP